MKQAQLIPIHNIEIELIDLKMIASTTNLFSKLLEILKPSYEEPIGLLKRELQHCNKLYIAKTAGVIISFFMVAWEQLCLHGKDVPSVYLGLSATQQSHKNTGSVQLLYRQFMQDAQTFERQHSIKLIIWYTTITPSVFKAINSIFVRNTPDNHGNYSPESREIVLAIREKMGWQEVENNAHPFVLKNIVFNTRYSLEESARIEKICKEKKFTLFSDLGINEKNGDRLLRLCCIPD